MAQQRAEYKCFQIEAPWLSLHPALSHTCWMWCQCCIAPRYPRSSRKRSSAVPTDLSRQIPALFKAMTKPFLEMRSFMRWNFFPQIPLKPSSRAASSPWGLFWHCRSRTSVYSRLCERWPRWSRGAQVLCYTRAGTEHGCPEGSQSYLGTCGAAWRAHHRAHRHSLKTQWIVLQKINISMGKGHLQDYSEARTSRYHSSSIWLSKMKSKHVFPEICAHWLIVSIENHPHSSEPGVNSAHTSCHGQTRDNFGQGSQGHIQTIFQSNWLEWGWEMVTLPRVLMRVWSKCRRLQDVRFYQCADAHIANALHLVRVEINRVLLLCSTHPTVTINPCCLWLEVNPDLLILSLIKTSLSGIAVGMRCHTPNRFGTVNMEDNINIEWSWCKGWARRSLIVAIYRTRRLSWCERRLPTSSSHHSHKNHQEAEETEGITSIMVWERNAIYCSQTPIPEWVKKLKKWWRNEGKKRRNDVSAQMSFLGAQCWHSNILNSFTISKAIRHMTIL